MNTDPFEAMIMSPAVHDKSTTPHVPNQTIAIGPYTAYFSSRTTKSIIGVPIPVATIEIGTPQKVPVKVLKVQVETILIHVSGLSKNLESFQAR